MRQFILSVFLAVIFANVLFSQIVLVANLEGSQEVPAVTTAAKGTAWLIINTDYRTVTYQVTYARLQGTFTASHFHLASAGTNGPVVKAISYNGNTSSGTWNDVPDSIIAKLIKGQVYVNVHSSSFTGGEIRGQLMVAKGIAHTADLTGSQEVPSNSSTARGTGYLILDSTGLTTNYRVTIAGLSSAYSASHIHIGAAGVSGGVVKATPFSDSTAEGSWTGQTNQNLVDLVKNKLYFNVHTANFPSGEIRGQILQTGTISFAYELDGSQEVPAVTTTGKGTGFAVLTPMKDTLYYYLAFARLSSAVTGSHVHIGSSGVSGPVAFPIVLFTPNYTAAFGQIVIDSLIGYALRGGLYANIHTSTNPGGEIRGQIRPSIGIAFQSNPSGINEVPSVLTNGRGAGSLIYSPELNSLRYRFTVAGLSANLTASHIHYGQVGTSGGVQNAISFNGDSTASGSWDNLKDSVLTGLLNAKYYFNEHTTTNPGGEIRGQITSFKFIIKNVPVELTSFNVLAEGMTAKLDWSTATEKNNMGFAIERGTDGITFKQCSCTHV
ncbi:MAG: CHRD domain-containing protein [Ignavibacteriales bacterium]|nr:CHRD domain-containing protein [Ignavibacteriales bacterium]